MITTEGAEEDKKKALAIGANAYLTKPIQTQELMKLVNSLLHNQIWHFGQKNLPLNHKVHVFVR